MNPQQNSQSFDIKLNDIKPILEVQEYSFYYFLGLSFVLLLLILGVSYLIYMWIKQRNAFNIRKEHIGLLKSLDLSDTKQSAYDITRYGVTFRDDSLRHKEMFENITNRLATYKYKKEVKEFDKETLEYIKLYEDMIDV
ncbi:MAG: hypothetical protein L3J10_01545 [Sulfurimonas sp.]|nr:hypothetical protein [Sulfurimonas sp.]